MESPSTLSEEVATQTPRLEAPNALKVALLTGGIDRHYAFGLAMALAAKNVEVDVIGSDDVDSPELHSTPHIRFFNLWPARQAKPSLVGKVSRTLRHYISLIRYAAGARPRVFHILWNSKVKLFDRTALMLYYKMLAKKVTLTAHNVNEARRDAKDSALNRLTLRIQYRLADHIFVHTQKMKSELVEEFGVAERRITVIRYPLNNVLPETDLTAVEAKGRLGIRKDEKAIICFGRIKPYKGIEHLLTAFRQLVASDSSYRLIVAGEVQKGNEAYLDTLTELAARELSQEQMILKTQFIPDAEMEVYFKAADVLVLPYNEIFQSGVLFLSYNFGLPVIATDVGSFREVIVEGVTGYICRPSDAVDLAGTIETYFTSDLYRNLETRRQQIREYAETHHSWGAVADLTRNVYTELLRTCAA